MDKHLFLLRESFRVVATEESVKNGNYLANSMGAIVRLTFAMPGRVSGPQVWVRLLNIPLVIP